ncbi:hypothetical protein C7B65_13710 [Phormidesmis priestleyi ULC007]|uniref:Uncharacterized protein n=1 Tax=Phormidesmis priestleyi ULC007 TaxID=1920490 RepID=A0A2T1DED4_9CYAN|nr:hypothetical protein [Phormidesmis priestleyi]PSB18827.1 hypothetical protein C7B65_13710 [Phormidesmis priestleyi ULC007]PZO51034.1 MAG: hypothetical protein DCF14_10105 [Phormidesmis priestleyi]
MQKKSLIACVGAFSILVGGCASEQSNNPPASPSPAAVQPFSRPLVSEKAGDKKANLAAARIPGLLQSTDPAERARQVQAGINVKKNQNDPFASLAPLITFKTPAGTSGTPAGNDTSGSGTGDQTASPPQLPSSRQAPQSVASGRSPTPPAQRSISRRQISRSSTPSVASKPSTPTITALPPLPEPTLARAVEVSGVVVVGGVPQAIVKAPNEATTRYVRAGQRLSNGQILVKRIEVNGGSDPVVILEQNGIEVSRAVGDKPSLVGGSPTAIAPTFQFRV